MKRFPSLTGMEDSGNIEKVSLKKGALKKENVAFNFESLVEGIKN